MADSIGDAANGTVTDAGYSWVTGAPFDIPINHAPVCSDVTSPRTRMSGLHRPQLHRRRTATHSPIASCPGHQRHRRGERLGSPHLRPGLPTTNGADPFTYRAYDGQAYSNIATVAITVTAVNDAPSFSKGADQAVAEDAGPQTVAGWATAISPGPANEAAQTVAFEITGDTNPALFSAGPAVSPSGDLTYTSAPNANGSATISLVVHDTGGTANGGVDTSASQSFAISVTPVNDAPSFSKGADQTVAEDAGPQTVAGWATAISPGPANEAAQTVAFEVTGDTNPALFSAGPAVPRAAT